MSTAKEAEEVSEITSRLVTFPGPRGRRIVGYLDEGLESLWNERVVVLAPRYGETKKNNLQLSYLLAANGFKVLRFDQTNHIGDSDGTMDQFTLVGVADDIVAVVDYVDRYFEPAEIVLTTLSLSARCGLRACAQDKRISRYVCLVGMVNMDRTLKAIYNRDFFGELAKGATWTKVDILGFEIDGARFYKSLIESNMLDLAGTIEDASKVTVPALHLFADNDLWVVREDVEAVMSQCSQGVVESVKDVGHEINENPQAVQQAFGRLLVFCSEGMAKPSLEKVPCKRTLIAQNKLERTKLQATMKFTEAEHEFWGDYLGKFGIIESAEYYVEYFKTVCGLLGAIQPYDVVLDAGCGNGFYGVSLMRSMIQEMHTLKVLPNPVHYCGLDLTQEGLFRSYSRHVDELIHMQRDALKDSGFVNFSYRKLNFDSIGGEQGASLPFADSSISKVCCSLVLSYLKEPIHLMKELSRVLKPGGVGVVSSMKPGCDMTVLYHNYVTQDESEKKEEDASVLLGAAGRIKLKKDSGIYAFFEFDELEQLALAAGFSEVRCYRSFGDQANVIRIVK
ncbi:MAG: methyltransferase domain-containing protein [Opitutaceae bacterium]